MAHNYAANLADVDPLNPAKPVTFDEVGGMESHVQQLKEMVQLPLLYPEVFQRFSITPPRGVLFHGPPGTGKTLLARALAASCSSEGQKICKPCIEQVDHTQCRAAFFMRKGADCLSKWVGEAERQLRMLFDEAKACQPSIIFFDEIDGMFRIHCFLEPSSDSTRMQAWHRFAAANKNRFTPPSSQRY